jgi:hypothetical protein
MVDPWLKFFIALTAIAFVAQATALVLAYLRLKKLDEETRELRRRVTEHSGPILRNVEDTTLAIRENSRLILDDVTAFTQDARRQMEKFDRFTDEVADRLRVQVIRLDQLLTEALDNLEQAGAAVKETVVEPVREAVAVMRGVKAAIDFISSRRQRPARERASGRADEELFI